jgi:hypothetical protein
MDKNIGDPDHFFWALWAFNVHDRKIGMASSVVNCRCLDGRLIDVIKVRHGQFSKKDAHLDHQLRLLNNWVK